jgi:hypothetical protein
MRKQISLDNLKMKFNAAIEIHYLRQEQYPLLIVYHLQKQAYYAGNYQSLKASPIVYRSHTKS